MGFHCMVKSINPLYHWNFFAPSTSKFSESILFPDCCHFTGTDDKFMKPCGRILQAAALAAGTTHFPGRPLR